MLICVFPETLVVHFCPRILLLRADTLDQAERWRRVQLVTKSGSNFLHGSGYEYFRNEALNANDPNLKAVGEGRPVMKTQRLRRHAGRAHLQKQGLLLRLLSGHTRG